MALSALMGCAIENICSFKAVAACAACGGPHAAGQLGNQASGVREGALAVGAAWRCAARPWHWPAQWAHRVGDLVPHVAGLARRDDLDDGHAGPHAEAEDQERHEVDGGGRLGDAVPLPGPLRAHVPKAQLPLVRPRRPPPQPGGGAARPHGALSVCKTLPAANSAGRGLQRPRPQPLRAARRPGPPHVLQVTPGP